MKINWGWGLVIGMVAFIAFILYFVITMSTDTAYEHDLVTEDYYAKEMVYQEEIDAESNLQNLEGSIESKKVENGWEIIFPKSVDVTKIKGTLFLYRPSNQKLDFETPLNLTDHNLLIPDDQLIGGRWNIIMEWEYKGETYLYKESITY